MKKCWFIMMICSSLSCYTLAQSKLKGVYRVNTYEAVLSEFFRHNSDIERIVLEYNNGSIKSVDVYSKNSDSNLKNTGAENYVMTFDGDRFMFVKRYPTFKFPNASELKTKFLKNIQHISETDTLYTLTTTLRPDSSTHFFEFFIEKASENIPMYHLRNRPYLKGNLLKVQSKLAQNFKVWKPLPSDSMVVMTGVVGKDGILKDLKILGGPTSAYSIKLLEAVAKEVNPWWPVVQAGKRLEWTIKISVRIINDKTIKISML